MSLSALTFSTSPATDSSVDAVVIGVVKDDSGPRLLAPAGYEAAVNDLAALGATGACEQVVRLEDRVGGARALVLLGLGDAPDANSLRSAAGAAVRSLAGLDRVAFAIPVDSEAEAEAIGEGALLGAYAFTAFRHSSLDPAKKPVAEVTVHTDRLPSDDAQERIRILAEAVHRVRDLVNTPPSDLFPESFAAQAATAAAENGLEVRIWDEQELATDGFGGILGVGQGSSRGPRLVRLSYRPENAAKRLAVVGKGITFDSGGLSLKPMVSMIGMKSDMAGAAVALAATVAAAKLHLPIQVTAWLCLAENMPSGTATRPNDVLRIRDGHTVEVVNTDAEGRLVLADGLAAASEEHPDAIVDVATLTGAQVVALGHRYSAVLGDDALVERLRTAAAGTGELFWPMPIPEETLARLDSDVADMKNATPGDTAAGMLLAAAFLREFVGRTADDATTIPWAHLDIAGAALNTGKAFGFTGVGGTGVAVRTLIGLAESLSRG